MNQIAQKMDSMHDTTYLHRLKKNRVALVRDLIPDSIADHLLAEDILNEEEYEAVMYCNQTTAGRNRKLLDIVSTKGPKGYEELRNALVADFKWLADILDSTPPPPTKPAETEQLPMVKQEMAKPVARTEPQVGDEAIDIVVKNLLSVGSLMSWKFIARKLGFSEDKINEIEYRSPRDIRAQIYEMLYFWRQGELGPASLERLCQVLTDEGRLAAAAAVRQSYWKYHQGGVKQEVISNIDWFH